jgi:hypothetical protein
MLSPSQLSFHSHHKLPLPHPTAPLSAAHQKAQAALSPFKQLNLLLQISGSSPFRTTQGFFRRSHGTTCSLFKEQLKQFSS